VTQVVLIVEDDRPLAAALARSVEQMGYVCRQAHDGASALQAVAAAAPDVVLLDLLLPRKDGRAVLQTLQSNDATRALPVIAMSGVFRGREHEQRTLEAGARALLEKPFPTERLEALLRELIGRPRAGTVPTRTPPAPARTPPAAAADEPPAEAADALDLCLVPAPEVLWQAVAQGFEGALHFRLRKRHKVVLMEGGRPVAVRSNLAREALGRRLLDAGRIDQPTLDESLRRAQRSGRAQGEILVELGALTPPELERALEEQGAEKLLELLSWTEGQAWRQPGVRELPLASRLEGWTPERLALRGMERIDPAVLRRILEPLASCRVRRTQLPLAPELRRAAGARLVERAERGVGVADLGVEALPALYALWRAGALALQAPEPGRPSAAPARATAAAAPPRAPQPSAPPAAPPPPTATAAPPPPAPSAAASGPAAAATGSVPQAERIARLRGQLEQHRRQDHYQALGVERSDSPAKIREAFVRAAKSFHPDRFADATPEVRELAGQVFARLSQAHDVLSDPEQRRAYDRELANAASRPADRSAIARIMNAEQRFQEAEAQVRRREWTEAQRTLREVLELDPEEGEYHSLLGWATLMAEPESERARSAGLELLRKGIALAPRSPSGYYYLGMLHKICGRMAEAETMLRKVVELRPKHGEANQELRLLERRRDKTGPVSRGLFGFKGKK
jgi:CheY-like chemotaxis protein/Flp pilus assembly protein TadD